MLTIPYLSIIRLSVTLTQDSTERRDKAMCGNMAEEEDIYADEEKIDELRTDRRKVGCACLGECRRKALSPNGVDRER